MKADKIDMFASELTDEIWGKREDCRMIADMNKWAEVNHRVKAIIRKHCNRRSPTRTRNK